MPALEGKLMFDSTKKDLREILLRVHTGKLQLPDFQRDYVWGDTDVRSLIASIAKGFPVGALLTLQAGSQIAFKPRLLQGVPAQDVAHEDLLLDGQQRITSLYQALFAQQPVTTRLRSKKVVERYYYLDIKKAAGGQADIYDAIIAVPEDRVIQSTFGKKIERDLSRPELEFEHDMFPLNKVFDSKDWFYGWRDYCKEQGRDIYDLEKQFDRSIIDVITHYKMPIIELDNSNSREAICLVFEKVNIGGKKLDAFELLTAIYAADEFDIREAWDNKSKTKPGVKQKLVGRENSRRVLKKIRNTEFLQACTLLHTRKLRMDRYADGVRGQDLPQITCNRQAMLGLPLSAYKTYAKPVEDGFIKAAEFLWDLKILSARDVPYSSQIVALAAIFAILGKDAENLTAKQKLTRWFWCGALGALYGTRSDTQMARDVPKIIDWVRSDGPPPPTIDECVFRQNRLRNLRTRQSAAYKTINALLMVHGCKDFVSGDGVELMTFFEHKIDIHHIFPQKWCGQHKIEDRLMNSIINKTPLSKRSNTRIGGHAPSIYLSRIEDKDGIPADNLDGILQTHLIDPELLRADDFSRFYEARLEALSTLIGDAMGKPVVTSQQVDEESEETEAEDSSENDPQG